jgi:hypothetical protein
MKASELRIGNFTTLGVVYLIDQDVFRVVDNEGDSFKNTWANIQPIPLSEKWLLKFGFETNDVRYWQISSFRLHINRYGEWIFKVETFEQEIKYVHQLQNLYFALKGEELTIKNK